MFLLSVWMSNLTFIAGQCLDASHSNDSRGVMLCHVKGTSVNLFIFCFPTSGFSSYIYGRFVFMRLLQNLSLRRKPVPHKGPDSHSTTMQFRSTNIRWEMAHNLQKCALWISVTAAGKRKKKIQGVATSPFSWCTFCWFGKTFVFFFLNFFLFSLSLILLTWNNLG